MSESNPSMSEDESSDWSVDSIGFVKKYMVKADEFQRARKAMSKVIKKYRHVSALPLVAQEIDSTQMQMITEISTEADHQSIPSDDLGTEESQNSITCANTMHNTNSEVYHKDSSYANNPMALHAAKAHLNLQLQYLQDTEAPSTSRQHTTSVEKDSENYLSFFHKMLDEDNVSSSDSEYDRLQNFYDVWSKLMGNTKSVPQLVKIDTDDDSSSEEEFSLEIDKILEPHYSLIRPSQDYVNEDNRNEHSSDVIIQNIIDSMTPSSGSLDVQPSTSYAETNPNSMDSSQSSLNENVGNISENPVIIRYVQERLLYNNNLLSIMEDDTLDFYSHTKNLEQDFSAAGDFSYEIEPERIIQNNANNHIDNESDDNSSEDQSE
ncbi:uncharacterized protein LOC119671455 [Teleopsis dalmanni]|uniref:uncharacterized protein LOC119671455 n=1 Tax=Teleopsis dalmanni TaxID=139649 RepID=UPI000D32A6AF|nr:uncharacterized protein LOC119671455 [Teleopsis dalmanni]